MKLRPAACPISQLDNVKGIISMSQQSSFQSGRYTATSAPGIAEGWQLQRLTQPSRLFGANGLRTGADGRIYVAQVAGRAAGAADPASGPLETIFRHGGP